MSVVAAILLVILLAGTLIFERLRHGAFFEPSVKEDYPRDLKPFLKMDKSKYRATANPRHTLLPILEKIREEEKEAVASVDIDLIGYKFDYEGYLPGDKWYQTLKKIVEKGGHVNIIGGLPGKEASENVKTLGANFRFLEEPPTTHLFIYSQKHTPVFIWFEGEHKDGRARCIAYTKSPSKQDIAIAKDYFSNLWASGISMGDLQA